MNEQSDLERYVADQLGSAAVGTPPEAAITETIERAGRSRRLPEWLALIKEPPMRTNSHLAVGSPTVRVTAILAATILATLLVVSAGVAGAQLFAAGPTVVDGSGNGDFTTITEAVAMAVDGDEIIVKPGTYTESVTIDKDISITGDGSPGEIVIEIADDGPTDVTIFNARPRYAIFIDGADATVGNLTVVGPTRNISAFIVIGGSPIIHDVVANLEPSGGYGGFVFMDGGGGVIRDNATDLFLWVDGGSTPEIVDNVSTNVIRPNGAGTDPWIHGNVATGIWAHDGAAPLVEDNDISGSTGADCGIEAGDVDTNPIVRGNRVSGNDVGICAYDGGSIAVLTDNTVTGNLIGLRLDSPSDVLDLADNTICDNEQDIAIRGEPPSEGEACASAG